MYRVHGNNLILNAPRGNGGGRLRLYNENERIYLVNDLYTKSRPP